MLLYIISDWIHMYACNISHPLLKCFCFWYFRLDSHPCIWLPRRATQMWWSIFWLMGLAKVSPLWWVVPTVMQQFFVAMPIIGQVNSRTPVGTFYLPDDKTNNMTVRPAKTQISLGIHPIWSESLLSAWRYIASSATHWAHCEDWPDWADAQADLSLRWAHRPYCLFCHEAAHLSVRALPKALLRSWDF